jgi:para-aminobenzoate synthetase component I
MRFDELKNYVYVPPEAGGKAPGVIYLLSDPTSRFSEGFAVIPYTDGSKHSPAPVYYPIAGAIRWEYPDFLAFTDVESPVLMKCDTPKEDYIRKVEKLKANIQRGDIYEINYCIEFYAENVSIEPFNIFIKLHDVSKAPYSYLLKLGEDYVICCSPELFLERKGDSVITKPVKGTIRRGRDEVEDELLKQELHNSLKERTENVMAVDVARNDLSQFAEKGTVSVNRLYNIETFETVHQMVSTVSCKPKVSAGFPEMIAATFPMASMTGAPKIRAMQLIAESESFNRKYYSGAIGFVNQNEFSLAVVIRSVFYNRATRRVSFCVGSAITHLSDAEKEYEECLLKAWTMMNALNAKMG